MGVGYRVEYGPRKRRGPGVAGAAAVWLVVFFLLVGLFWPQGARTLRGLLTPGDPAVTAAALERFAGEVRSGEPLEAAVRQLYRQITRRTDGR